MYCRRKGEALRLSTGMLKKPWISFWWRSMVIRWVRPAQTRSGWRWWHLQSRQLQQCVKTCAVEGNTLVLLTSFTHHRGDELWDDGASLPHLTLLAVGEVREDACDASGTGCPARVHHDQHLHYGGVHVSDTAERWREKRGGMTMLHMSEMFQGKSVLKWSITRVVFLTWTLSGSQTHLCLSPTPGSAPAFLWKQTGHDSRRSSKKVRTHKHAFMHTLLPHNKACRARQLH